MAEPPDMDELARRYLDLWQEHLSLAAADPDTMDALGRIIASLSAWAPAPGVAPGMPIPGGPFAWGPNAQDGRGTTQPADSDAPGTASAAAASDDGDGAVDLLNRRIALLEDRIARLESALAGQGGETAGRARRR